MRGPIPGGSSLYPKIKQGFLYDGDMECGKRDNQIFMISIEARCQCGLHNKYQDWMQKCEEELKE